METVKNFKVYIAGPMESVGGNFNIPLFDFVAKKLRDAGCEVYSPADNWPDLSKMDKHERRVARRAGMRLGVNWIFDHANIILMLPGWESSPGAMAEFKLAQALGITIREAPNILVMDAKVDVARFLE